MLWANMVLHDAAAPEALIAQWHRALATDGFLMFSCLGPDTLRELRGLYQALGWPPAGHEFTDMHDWGDMLVHAGFAEPVMDMERITLTYETPARLLQDLRELGRNLHPQRFAALRGRAGSRQLEREWRTAGRAAQGRLALTFEIIYGHAMKAQAQGQGQCPEFGVGRRTCAACCRTNVRPEQTEGAGCRVLQRALADGWGQVYKRNVLVPIACNHSCVVRGGLMSRRIYWLIPDVPSARRTMDDLLLARVPVQKMHFFGREGTPMTGLHAANVFQTTDVIYAAETGLLIGGTVGIVAGLLVAMYYPISFGDGEPGSGAWSPCWGAGRADRRLVVPA